MPQLLAVDPEVVVRDAGGTQVDLLGLGFVDASVVRWNGEDRTSAFSGSTRLTVTLTGRDLEAPGGALVVVNPEPGGGQSEPMALTVGNPSPQISGMSPTEAPAVVAGEVTLTISGLDFVDGDLGSRILWNGIPIPTTFVGPTELMGMVPDYLLQTGDSVFITVLNPPPGGGQSAPALFGVENPVPDVTGVDPGGVPVRTDATIHLFGSGFTYGSRVWLDGTELQPTSISESTLSVRVPGAMALGGSTLSLRVENPPPGGGFSEAVELDVWEVPPRIAYLSPSHVFAGASDFTLTIAGEDFDPDAEVQVNGQLRSATFEGPGRLILEIEASDVALSGEVEIRVTNPGAGSVGQAVLTVLAENEFTGRIVAERWGAVELTTANLDGTGQSTVRPETGVARVDASPLGFQAAYHGSERIHEIDLATESVRRLTVGTAAADLVREAWPRYSADGAWVYFNGLSGARGGIWRVRTDGSSAEEVLSSPTQWVGYPAPSHDGDRLVYATREDGGPLHVYDIEEGTSTPLGVSGVTSRWSPDDQWIVYLTPVFRLRAVRPDGSEDHALVTGISAGFGFDFSPDGSSIVSTTQDGNAFLVSFPSGLVEYLPEIGQVASIAFFGP